MSARSVARRYIDALREAWRKIEKHATEPQQVAALMARHSTRQMVYERGMGITIVELQLAAALYEELRPVIREWGRAYAQIVRKTLLALGSADPYADAALLMNTTSGLVLGQLALPNGDFENGNARPTLLRLLHVIRDEPARDVSHQA